MLPLVLAACHAPTVPPRAGAGEPIDPGPYEPTGSLGHPTDPPAVEPVPWTVAVWMAADNDLEPLVEGDLDELERAATEGFSIVVQADRIPGYDDFGGDWTDTRRIEIVPDVAPGPVSPVVEELGEVDMGDGHALAAFLEWVVERYPSERLAVVFWNHGAGFWIASDDTSDGDNLRIEDGELTTALSAAVEARGRPIDLVGFDACNMGEWEVGYALAEVADVMVASEAWVGYAGYAYDEVLPAIAPTADGAELGERLAWSAGEVNGELTHAAVDLVALGATSAAVDALALAWLDDPGGIDDFVRARDAARGVDRQWDEFWLDLGSLADNAASSALPEVAEAGLELREELDAAVLANYTQPRMSFASGLTVFTDTSEPHWIELYGRGPWADTHWDDIVTATHDAGY